MSDSNSHFQLTDKQLRLKIARIRGQFKRTEKKIKQHCTPGRFSALKKYAEAIRKYEIIYLFRTGFEFSNETKTFTASYNELRSWGLVG